MKVGDEVLCTTRIHGAFRKGHLGKVTAVEDDVVEIDGIKIDAEIVGKHFTKKEKPDKKKRETK